MSGVVKILTINNETEARLLEQILKDNNIPFYLKCYRDPAYDGIFQMQMGWGHIEADEKYRSFINEVYGNILEYKKLNKFDEPDSRNSQKEINLILISIFLLLVLVIAIIFGVILIRQNIKLKRIFRKFSKIELLNSESINVKDLDYPDINIPCINEIFDFKKIETPYIKKYYYNKFGSYIFKKLFYFSLYFNKYSDTFTCIKL